MPINHTKKCNSCEAKNLSDSSSEIGEQVHIAGGKEGDTNHTFYQCKDCGSVWMKIEDIGGLGGHGTFFHLLTKGFY